MKIKKRFERIHEGGVDNGYDPGYMVIHESLSDIYGVPVIYAKSRTSYWNYYYKMGDDGILLSNLRPEREDDWVRVSHPPNEFLGLIYRFHEDYISYLLEQELLDGDQQ